MTYPPPLDQPPVSKHDAGFVFWPPVTLTFGLVIWQLALQLLVTCGLSLWGSYICPAPHWNWNWNTHDLTNVCANFDFSVVLMFSSYESVQDRWTVRRTDGLARRVMRPVGRMHNNTIAAAAVAALFDSFFSQLLLFMPTSEFWELLELENCPNDFQSFSWKPFVRQPANLGKPLKCQVLVSCWTVSPFYVFLLFLLVVCVRFRWSYCF